MKSEYKTGFGIHNEPKIVLSALDFDHSLVSVPLIGAEVKRRNELKGDVLKEWRKASAPIGNSCVRDGNVVQNAHHECNLTERVIADKEHDNGGDDDMNRITHT